MGDLQVLVLIQALMQHGPCAMLWVGTAKQGSTRQDHCLALLLWLGWPALLVPTVHALITAEIGAARSCSPSRWCVSCRGSRRCCRRPEAAIKGMAPRSPLPQAAAPSAAAASAPQVSPQRPAAGCLYGLSTP